MSRDMCSKIDVVLPWVDGDDPEWKRQKAYYSKDRKYPAEAISNYRFRTWDNLTYWFRSIEKYMPWINKVFFITAGHLPDFLNPDCNKLRIVKHSDYIPEEYLPTFSSTPIQMNLHRIADLSEKYILFNDDVFPVKKIEPGYFFVNDMVCDEAIQTVVVPHEDSKSIWQCRSLNNIRIINKHFNKRKVINDNRDKWFSPLYSTEDLERNKNLEYWNNFTGFRGTHMANPYKKSILSKIWNLEFDALDKASRNRFRDYTDVTDYVIRYWQLCEGCFVPRKTCGQRVLLAKDSYNIAVDCILNQREIMLSIEDEYVSDSDFNVAKTMINKAFETMLPDKCSFEK